MKYGNYAVQFQVDMPVFMPDVVAAADSAFEDRLGDLDGSIIVFGAQFIDTKNVATVIEEEEPKHLHC